MQEDAERAEHELRELEHAGLTGVGFGDVGAFVVGVDLRQGRPPHQQAEHGQHRGDGGVRRDDTSDEFVERGGLRGRVHRRQRREQRGIRHP